MTRCLCRVEGRPDNNFNCDNVEIEHLSKAEILAASEAIERMLTSSCSRH